MNRRVWEAIGWVGTVLFVGPGSASFAKTPKVTPPKVAAEWKDFSALDRYLGEIQRREGGVPAAVSPGSIFTPGGRFTDLGRDFRASLTGDAITIVVSDRATAVATGSTNASRASSAKAGVTAALGPLRAAGPLGQLAGSSSDTSLKGSGETSRSMQLSTTVTAIVEQLLPNGNLVVRGAKSIRVNSEYQTVTIRGIVRPEDLQAGNQVPSDKVAMLDVRIDGKGVVADSIRRPFWLYRILMGILPF